MYRILLSSLVLLSTATTVLAQTAPASTRQSASKAAPSTAAATKTAAEAGTQPAATSATDIASDGLRDSAGLKMQNVYAAPGMPVIVKDGKVGPYDGKAAESKQNKSTRKSNTTLSPQNP